MAKLDRLGGRRGRSARKERKPALGRYLIITDTAETEKNYLQGLRDSLPEELRPQIVFDVFSTKTERLVETCKEKASLAVEYAQLWIVLDRDLVPGFDNLIAKAEKEGIHVAWSNPCIEIWFEAYWGNMPSRQGSVDCCNKFRETYEKKTGKEYQKSTKDIYADLNRTGDEKAAIQRAEKRLQQHQKEDKTLPSQMSPGTTLHHLVAEVRGKTGW